jgi:ATP-binding cassette, subfamily C (CFTR/MRP), member 1
VIVLYGALQLPLLLLWSFQLIIRRGVSITAASLSFVNALVLCWLSHVEHAKSLQPSTVITVYLIISLLFDVVQVRTLWLATYSMAITWLFTASFVTKLVALVLEIKEKAVYLSLTDRLHSPEELSGILNRSVFYWINRLIMRGARSVLLSGDLYPLCEDISTVHLTAKFWPAWEKAKRMRHKHSALLATFSALKWAVLLPVFPRLVLIAFTICQPLLLRTLLNHLQKPDVEIFDHVGYSLIGAYGLVYLGLTISTGFYWSLHFRALTMTRGCLVSAIYRKTTEISLGAIDDTNAAVTLMSADVERIVLGLKMGHEIWAGLIQVALATWLLEGELGIACLAPIFIAISCGFAATWVSRTANDRQKRWMEAVQIRIGVTSTMLSSIRGIKMTGLTDKFRLLIRSLRLTEISCVNRFRLLQIWTAVIAFTPDLAAPVATFAVFMVRARSSGEILDVSRLFTSVSLLVLLTLPLNQLFQSIPLFLAAVSCFRRIGDFLCEEVRVDRRVVPDAADWYSSAHKSRSQPDEQLGSIELRSRLTRTPSRINALDSSDTFTSEKWSCGWTKDSKVLKAVDISIPRAKLTLIVGSIGTGKSTLCKALLGETLVSESYVRLNERSRDLAFCDQTPYLINASIQQNIIGFSSLDRKWYNTVVRATALDEDLASLPNGDQQLIGSNGVNLSGGQKHKVAIARAVYARKRVAIFDDVLSGLDATSEEHVFLHIFGPQGLLRQQHTTVILSTHAVRYLPCADHIIALGVGGNVMEQGSFLNLNAVSGYVQSLSVQAVAQKESTSLEAGAAEPIPAFRPAEVEAEILGKSRQEGELSTYRYYFRAAGLWNKPHSSRQALSMRSVLRFHLSGSSGGQTQVLGMSTVRMASSLASMVYSRLWLFCSFSPLPFKLSRESPQMLGSNYTN